MLKYKSYFIKVLLFFFVWILILKSQQNAFIQFTILRCKFVNKTSMQNLLKVMDISSATAWVALTTVRRSAVNMKTYNHTGNQEKSHSFVDDH